MSARSDEPWKPGDALLWPQADNRYIHGLVRSEVDASNRVLALSRIGQEWESEMAMMTMPFSERERTMMSFIANTLIEGVPEQYINSMSCTVGDIQTAIASHLYGSMEYDLSNDRTSADADALYDSIADQFFVDPRQPGLPLKQRIPSAVHVYEQLENVEFELANTSHGENVMMGRTPALPITNLNFRDSQTPSKDRHTWFLGIFLGCTLREREVRDSFLDTGMLRKRTLINRHLG